MTDLIWFFINLLNWYIGIPSIEPIQMMILQMIVHNITITFSYNFQFDWASSWAMVPSFLIKSTKVTDPQVDLNLKLIYRISSGLEVLEN